MSLTYTAEVNFHDVKELLPDANSMIIAEDGEWHILMYERENFGYEWEDSIQTEVRFSRWAYLGDLYRRRRKKK